MLNEPTNMISHQSISCDAVGRWGKQWNWGMTPPWYLQNEAEETPALLKFSFCEKWFVGFSLTCLRGCPWTPKGEGWVEKQGVRCNWGGVMMEADKAMHPVLITSDPDCQNVWSNIGPTDWLRHKTPKDPRDPELSVNPGNRKRCWQKNFLSPGQSGTSAHEDWEACI